PPRSKKAGWTAASVPGSESCGVLNNLPRTLVIFVPNSPVVDQTAGLPSAMIIFRGTFLISLCNLSWQQCVAISTFVISFVLVPGKQCIALVIYGLGNTSL